MTTKNVNYALINNNGKYSAIRIKKGAEKTFNQIMFVASSKKYLISKIIKNGYDGYMNDGLISGLNDGERCGSINF